MIIRSSRAFGTLADVLRRWRCVTRRGEPTSETTSAPTFTQSVYGPFLLDTPGDRTFELCATGYGSTFVDDVIRHYDREFLFLDFGANLGLFSLLADRHPLCRRVLAFEPLPKIFSNLQANLVRNGASKVEAFCMAVTGTGRRHMHLSFDPRHSGMSKVLTRSGRGSVRVKTIGAFGLTKLVGGWRRPILAKIDVEGSEVDVLSALQGSGFYSLVEAIVIEISDRNLGARKKAELFHLLASDGFQEIARSGPEEHYDAHYRRRTLPS